MPDKIKITLLQISTSSKKSKNLEKVSDLISKVEESDIVVTPEYLMGLQDGEITREILRKNAEPLDSNFVNSLKEKAKEIGIPLLFTTYRKEKDYYNSSIFVDERGKIQGIYDKIHLFDAFEHKESEFFRHGENVTVFDWGKYKIGLATCFDLRFSELFRILRSKGADLILVPSGFYAGPYKTKQWKTLINSRAHENNLFMVGVNQPKPHFVGKSMVSSPWGYEVDVLGEEEEIKTVEIDLEEVSKARRKMPMDELLRPDFYQKYEPYRNK